jgi:biotin transport system substrate-specific component
MTAASPLALAVHDRLARPSAAVEAALIVLGSLVMAATAQLALPLPFTPVPVTGQTLGVLLVGASLGARRGAASMLLYLAQGAAGLPFFAGGTGGWPVLAGPTGGYLIGCVFAAYAVGWLAERGFDRRFFLAVPAFVLGECVVFVFGVPWLARFVGAERALAAGFWPFLPGTIVKAVVAATLLSSTWALVRRRERDRARA